MKKAFSIVFLVLLIDQAIKIYIKTHFFLGEEYRVAGNWFIIHFVENNGMAFGMELEFLGDYAKPLLTIFRIVLVTGLGWYIYREVQNKNVHTGLVVSLALIFAGAAGNIIDSVFYGKLFGNSDYETAAFLPAEGGYSDLLCGKVVDMFYFPIIEGHFPEWVPWWGTEQFIFFRPVFNFADASISVGVALILLFHKKFYPKPDEIAAESASQEST